MNETLTREAMKTNGHAQEIALDFTLKKETVTQTERKLSIAVMLPTYREAQNIENLIRDIQKLKLNTTIVVIDDSSPDGTSDIVRRLQDEYSNIILFKRPAKLGLGTAITAGFRLLLSLENPPDYIIAMDSDYSHNPRDIPRLVKTAMQGQDLVIGSRYRHGGKTEGWPFARQLISHVANMIATMMVGGKIQDCTSGFRCYSIEYVRNVISQLHSQTYEIQIETVKQAWARKFRVGEIPIVFSNRKRGKSKLTKAEFKGFLAYVLKTNFGVIIPEEDENKLRYASSKVHDMDERLQLVTDIYRRIRCF